MAFHSDAANIAAPVSESVRRFVNVSRWLLTAPLALLGHVAAVVSAIALTSLLKRLCPPEQIISGVCTASWYLAAELAAFSVSTAIGAFLFIALPVLVAPSHRSRVAMVALVAGVAYSLWFLAQVGKGLIVPACCAIASGAVTAWLVSSRSKQST